MNYQNFTSLDTKPKNINLPTMADLHRNSFLYIQDKDNTYNIDSVLKGIDNESPLSRLFFGEKNIEKIQFAIKYLITKMSKNKIKLTVDQDRTDLLVSMRAIYFEKAKNLNHDYQKQVDVLNKLVLLEIMPGIISNIKQEYYYLREINSPIIPLNRPI